MTLVPGTVLMVPGTMLFADLISVMPSESDTEVESRVKLALEADAPLPLARLAWGWCRVPAGAFYYAGTRERLAGVGARVDAADTPVCLPLFAADRLPPGVSAETLEAALMACAYADLRDRDLLARLTAGAAEATRMRRGYRLIAGIGAVGVLCLLVAGGLAVFNGVRRTQLRADGPRLAEVESKATMVSALERGGAALISPLEVLAELNARRPEGVVFSKFELKGEASVLLAGRSDTVDAVNRFAGALRAAGRFGDVRMENVDTTGGRTNFRLKLAAPRPGSVPSPAPVTPPQSTPGGRV